MTEFVYSVLFFPFFDIYRVDPPALLWEAPTSDLFPLASSFSLAVRRQVVSILTLNAQRFIASSYIIRIIMTQIY